MGRLKGSTDRHSQSADWSAPSCQPIFSHFVSWKSGNILEIALLRPSLAALRWFPQWHFYIISLPKIAIRH